ncbi:type III pantothenate kinase [Gloeobacter kilaueensis]|uniref:Type III pantothenate kinase n=1 Tax=Gloeobacter kilaueensis (strain ATCC BAA-2537 / CCAP 1431/1 / ULC 316 / JS1) TaxID=1183438 RepID=U5QI85_GLOK1|nr:type III pantothenate kinase [Gloeobacter kilaueensis]AGY57299.1 pantothenate kinase [Gloeobacter kilaueensis JS1]
MWLAVNIGNSRQHWGWFDQSTLVAVADYPLDYWDRGSIAQAEAVIVASVVPEALAPWQAAGAQILTLEALPLAGTYTGLGIDRALNLIAAADACGLPVLVVDLGTAITVSSSDSEGRFGGGCILPGFRTQFRALAQDAAALPEVVLPEMVPALLSFSTVEAIQAGVAHVALLGLQHILQQWKIQWAGGITVATGGDSPWVQKQRPDLFDVYEPHLTLWGIQVTRCARQAHTS